jgi:hypothetical protein
VSLHQGKKNNRRRITACRHSPRTDTRSHRRSPPSFFFFLAALSPLFCVNSGECSTVHWAGLVRPSPKWVGRVQPGPKK